MSRQFSQSVGQVSQQVSMVAMALAGAKRVFDFLDEKKKKIMGMLHLFMQIKIKMVILRNHLLERVFGHGNILIQMVQ